MIHFDLDRNLILIVFGITGLIILTSPERVTEDQLRPGAETWAKTHGYDLERISCVPRWRSIGLCDVSTAGEGKARSVQLRCIRDVDETDSPVTCRLNVED